MATKRKEVELLGAGLGCLGKADPEEPVFILRGQDALAADLVDEWAKRAQAAGCGMAKVMEAMNLANQMRNWPVHKMPD